MNELDLLTTALRASPDNLPLSEALAPRLCEAGRWVDVLVLLGPLARHADASAALKRAVDTAAQQLANPPAPTPAPTQTHSRERSAPLPVAVQPAQPEGLTAFSPLETGHPTVRFADVGGMDELKAMARLRIIQPFALPELFKKYGRTAGGGMLMYGPPGCGKTHFARAVAGECEAHFFNVGIHDILNLYVGNSERNVQQLFAAARAKRPAILFIDELDALCRKRDLMRHTSLTGTINAFLAEMDGLASDNANLLVVGATNAPWDIDPAFKRPGRFDQLLLVPPPDEAARSAILQLALARCPVAPDVSTTHWAGQTAGFSGADLTALVERATGHVLDQVLQGKPERPVDNDDLRHAIKATRPSSQEWMATARQYVEHANESGDYNDVAAYLDRAPAARRSRLGFL